MNIDENIQVSRSVAEGIVGNTILNEYEYDTLFAALCYCDCVKIG